MYSQKTFNLLKIKIQTASKNLEPKQMIKQTPTKIEDKIKLRREKKMKNSQIKEEERVKNTGYWHVEYQLQAL